MEYHFLSTNLCNLRCIYCYKRSKLDDDSNRFIVDPGKVEIFYKKVLAHLRSLRQRKVDFCWTGGEVFTIPLKRIRELVRLQKKIFPKGYRISNTFQTNLYHLTDEALSWIVKQGKLLRLGISIDFTERTRPARNGKASQDRVFKNMQRLRKKRVNFGLLCVVTNHNIDRMEEIYDWASENGVSFHFLPLMHGSIGGTASNDIDYRKYARTLVKLIERYIIDTKAEFEFANAVAYSWRVLKGARSGSLCTISPRLCASGFVSIDENYNMYPCPELEGSELKLGNALTDDLKHIWSKRHEVRRRLRRRIARLGNSQCRACVWKAICNKGCPGSALAYGNVDGPDKANCTINKIVFKELTKFYHDLGYPTRVNPKLIA